MDPLGPDASSSSSSSSHKRGASTSASTLSTAHTDIKKPKPKPEVEPASSLPPALQELATAFPSADKLGSHLNGLAKLELVSLLLQSTFPGSAKDAELEHCFYCHKTYRKADNSSSSTACKIKHWGEMIKSGEIGPDERMWACCGQTFDFADHEDHHGPPEYHIPYCYEGNHHPRHIKRSCENGGAHRKWWVRIEKDLGLTGCGGSLCKARKGGLYASRNRDVESDDEMRFLETDSDVESDLEGMDY